MKTLRFFGMAFMTILMCVGFSSCKDDDGPSVDSFIGVWEGIEADSWSIVPGYSVEDEWWADRPDKTSKRGVDISEIRVEFNSRQFYRIYTYNSYDKKWYRGDAGKWSISGDNIIMTEYDGYEYDEENPMEFKILERDGSKITLEYHKITPFSENYGKLTLRQIAEKDEMFDIEESSNSSDLDTNKPVKKTYPSEYIGTWLSNNDEGEGMTLKANGHAHSWDYEYGEWEEYPDDHYSWFVSDGKFFIDYEDGDGYAVCKVLKIDSNTLKLEYTGRNYTDEDGYTDEFIDEAGEIITYYKYN